MQTLRKLKLQNSLRRLASLKNDPVLLFGIIFLLALVVFFILIPLYNIFRESLGIDNRLSLENYAAVFYMYCRH